MEGTTALPLPDQKHIADAASPFFNQEAEQLEQIKRERRGTRGEPGLIPSDTPAILPDGTVDPRVQQLLQAGEDRWFRKPGQNDTSWRR